MQPIATKYIIKSKMHMPDITQLPAPYSKSSDKTFRFPPCSAKLDLQFMFVPQIFFIIKIFRPNRTFFDASAAFNANTCYFGNIV